MSAIAITPGAAWCPLPGAHYLHPMKTTKVPRRYVFIDTEAHIDTGTAVELQRWRLGCSVAVKWRDGSQSWSPAVAARHETPEALWEAVSAFARKDARTVVVAHNMAYDLRISRALEVLPAMGWTVSKLTLSAKHITVDLERDRAHLVLADSSTVFPQSMAQVMAWRGEPKPALPAEDAPAQEWWARCEADVTALAWAYMEVVDWLRRDDLGCWARTGAGMGWNTMLRHHLTEKVLVHGMAELHDLEGRTCYAGRCEAWRWGEQDKGPYTEWDYELAYAGIMREEALPYAYRDEVRGLSLERMAGRSEVAAFLVHAQVEADVPMLGWRDERGVLWPVGRFEGWWWHWELAEAVAAGSKVKVISAHRYSASPWLRGWAEWVTELVADRSTPEAKVRSAVAKQWQRSLVGRSAMRFADWREMGEAWQPGLAYWPMVEHGTGKRGAALMLGERRWEAWEQHWWDSALPQLLSAVMAHGRVRLWRAMLAAGLENLVYLDSDCVVTGPAGTAALTQATKRGALPGLRVKAVHRDLEVIAPQMVEGSTYRKLAGVPGGAKRVGQHTYEAERWEGLRTGLASGDPSVVAVRAITPVLRPVDWRRAHLPGGTTRPYRVDGEHRELPEGLGA